MGASLYSRHGLLLVRGAAIDDGDMIATRDEGGSQTAARFPAVRGRSLLGLEVELPRDFPAELTLAVVAFQRWHQDRVDRWIARAVVPAAPSRSLLHDRAAG